MPLVFKEPKYTGLDVELGDVTSEGVEHLLNEYPYIELVNQPETKAINKNLTPLNKGELGDPVILETDCGWMVHYYPPTDKKPARLKASKPQVVSSETDSELAALTVEQQTMRTAIELYKIMTDQGWDKFKVVSGTPRFTWSTWIVLSYNKQKLTGFVAKKNHKHIFEQVKDDIMKAMHKEISGEASVKKDVELTPKEELKIERSTKSTEVEIEGAPVVNDADMEIDANFGNDLGADVSIKVSKGDAHREKTPNKGKKRKK